MNNEIIFNTVNNTPDVDIVEITHRGAQIVRGTNKLLYIKYENAYSEIIGQITYTRSNLIKLIDNFLKIKKGIA